MRDYEDLPDDNNPRNDHGGVHINSGIPNKAFYLAATRLGDRSWQKAGPIWYDALVNRLRRELAVQGRRRGDHRIGRGAVRCGSGR